MTKEWAEDKRINPILYAKDENILISLSFQKAIEKRFADELKQHGGDERRVTFDLTPGPKPQIAAFVNRINAHSANQSIHGMIKKILWRI